VSNSKSINWFPDGDVKNTKLSNDPVAKYLDPIVVNKLTKLPEFKYYIENNFKIQLVDSIPRS
jgi:hypothetical protein